MDEEQEIQEEQIEETPQFEGSVAGDAAEGAGRAVRGVASGIGSGLAKLFSPSGVVRVPTQPQRTIGGLSLPMIVPQQPPAKRADDLSDLFEVPQPEDNDIYTDDLVELEVEDVFGGSPDMSDILSVSQADIMGKKPKPKVKFSRTAKLYPPTGIGGVQ